MVSTAVDASVVARVVGIKTDFKNLRGANVLFLPQRIVVIGQGTTGTVYPTGKTVVFSAQEAGETFGFGSPIHLSVGQLLPPTGDGVGSIPVTVIALEDAGGSVAAAGSIAPVGPVTKAGTLQIEINNIRSGFFTLEVGDTDADIVDKMFTAFGSNVNLPMTAVDGGITLDLTAKWTGTSSNALTVSVIGADDTGVAFGVTQPVGGAGNPDPQTALDKLGNTWETLLLNCLEATDTTALDAYADTNEGRWAPTVRKPYLAFVGNTEADPVVATAITDARGTDRTNVQLVSPGSDDLPFVVAARQLARIAPVANNNPPRDYAGQRATGLTPGADTDQWTFTQRDFAVKRGSSTIEVTDSVVELSDTVTMYHPTGDPTPAYRYVCDVIKVWQGLFNLGLIFEAPEWNGAPLIPDDQPTVNPEAKKPSMATAAIAGMIDSLALEAIYADPATAKKSIISVIDSGNPKRLNSTFTTAISGNTNIISVDYNFGFFFGTEPIVA